MHELFREMDRKLAKMLYGESFSLEFIEIFELAGFLKRKKDGIEINSEAIKEFLMLPEV